MTDKTKKNSDWKETRDAANDASIASSEALKTDALTTKDGKPTDLDKIKQQTKD